MPYLRSSLSFYLLVVLLVLSTSEALAKKPIRDSGDSTTSSCLSNRQVNQLAKEALVSLQAIDPTITLTDVKTFIKSSADCPTAETTAEMVADDYLAQMITITEPEPVMVNTPPTISGSPATQVAERSGYYFTPTASDADGDSLIFTISGKPDWASFNASTGTLSGTPDYTDAGTYGSIQISVSDSSDTADLPPFSIVVSNTNRSPQISGSPGGTVAEGDAYNFTPSAADPDGDSLSFKIVGKPGWAYFNTTNGTLSGTPGTLDAGTYGDIVITVTDGMDAISLNPFSVTVTDTNQAPTISGSPTTSIAEGDAYTFTPNATDPDGDSLSFSISGKPSWASFNTSTGTLSGTPSYEQAGTYSGIQISVSDGKTSTPLQQFSISVTDVTVGGEFNFANVTQSVTEGSVVTLVITRSNTTGHASVSYGTHGVTAQSTTVGGDDYHGFDPIEIVFQDGEMSKNITVQTVDDSTPETEETFEVYLRYPSTDYTLGSLSVATIAIADNDEAVNNPPTITGNPATSLSENSAYSFTPTASDADDDSLSFSIANKPRWAEFDTITGELFGTPGDNDAGIYSDITISVSDGTDHVSLTAFSITVEDTIVTTESADLAWEIPTTRTDGSPLALSEIGGYRVYMGPSSDNMHMIVDLNDGSATSYTITDLSGGSHNFSVTTYDLDGNESAYSNVAVKDIP